MTFSSSYETAGMADLITMLVRQINPVDVLEIGTQQGGSAQIIAEAMTPGGILTTCDLFEPKYRDPPYGDTHCSEKKARENLAPYRDKVHIAVLTAGYPSLLRYLHDYTVDLLHVDICNHYDNLRPILHDIVGNNAIYVRKMIILEGGIHNRWQKECGFDSYAPLLQEPWMYAWEHATIAFNDHNAITVLWRR